MQWSPCQNQWFRTQGAEAGSVTLDERTKYWNAFRDETQQKILKDWTAYHAESWIKSWRGSVGRSVGGFGLVLVWFDLEALIQGSTSKKCTGQKNGDELPAKGLC